MNKMKILMGLATILLFAPITTIQANTYRNQYPAGTNIYEFAPFSYKPFAEQAELSVLYLPSEITLKKDLFFSGSDSDDWLHLPHGDVENALKIPIDNGLNSD